MTVDNLLSQMGIGSKQSIDRYSEYTAPMHDQHVYYAYDSPTPSHASGSISKHGHGGGGGLKSNASMSALTLLAFLFFLHILQQCIKDHMNEMNTAPVMVMTAGREGEQQLLKSLKKVDKTGVTDNSKYENDKTKVETEDSFSSYGDSGNLMRIKATEHKPIRKQYKSEDGYENEDKDTFPGYVSAMDDI